MDNPSKRIRRHQGTLDAFFMVTPTTNPTVEHTEVEPIAPRVLQPQHHGVVANSISSNGTAGAVLVSSTVNASVSPYDVGQLISSGSSTLSDSDKIRLIDNCWKPSTSDALDYQYCQSKKRYLTFQWKWLDHHKWLAYSAHVNHRGGWCLPCVLFLSDVEKETLGVFVKTPFKNYNKSKESLSKHENNKYHKICIERAGIIRAQMANVDVRIDVQINEMATQIVKKMNRYCRILSTW